MPYQSLIITDSISTNLHVILGRHEGGPDGMDFDSQGNLLVANWGSGYIDVSKLHKTSIHVVQFAKCPNNMGHLSLKKLNC